MLRYGASKFASIEYCKLVVVVSLEHCPFLLLLAHHICLMIAVEQASDMLEHLLFFFVILNRLFHVLRSVS